VPEFSTWRVGLTKAERARLDEKMRLIQVVGTNAGCLDGPLRGHRHLYKIHVHGPHSALRPLLCRGPFDMNSEFTVLKPMRERGRKDEPPGARDEAERRRQAIEANKLLRIPYEVPQP
jgi:hypothetical protein